MNGLDEHFAKRLTIVGYDAVRKLSDGTWIGILRMAYTTGLFVGLSQENYERRYCFEHYGEALRALADWDGAGDPPGPWIKEKPSGRLGPGATGSHDNEEAMGKR